MAHRGATISTPHYVPLGTQRVVYVKEAFNVARNRQHFGHSSPLSLAPANTLL